MLPSHSLLDQSAWRKDTGPQQWIPHTNHHPCSTQSFKGIMGSPTTKPPSLHQKEQILISERFQMRSREQKRPMGSRVLLDRNQHTSYLRRTLICLSLFVGIIISLWRCNCASSVTSPLVISGLVEYDCKSFSWGRVIHVPLPKFWQPATFILLQMKMSNFQNESPVILKNSNLSTENFSF